MILKVKLTNFFFLNIQFKQLGMRKISNQKKKKIGIEIKINPTLFLIR